ncbi:hypothetical protein FQA47_002965 [Oryzias melastigma]|uniref:Uncharacterized protein n=1 Tax=Oryzias melastigma TaxID=30732 RepID=A0A834C1P6_ORYME|nr:hypothetical protein FQA47_002965 [Oryzias melastigma]
MGRFVMPQQIESSGAGPRTSSADTLRTDSHGGPTQTQPGTRVPSHHDEPGALNQCGTDGEGGTSSG